MPIFIESPQTLVSINRSRFAAGKTGNLEYQMSRPLLIGEERLNNQSYETKLPTFFGSTVIQLVNAEIAKRERENNTTPVTILDIGYGQGRALLGCDGLWGKKVKLTGYGDSTYTRLERKYRNDPTLYPPTYEALQAANIELIEGNAIDMHRLLPDDTYDFIMSVFALNYVEFPRWGLVKKLYPKLRPNGVALLHSICLSLENRFYGDTFENLLGVNGYYFETHVSEHARRKTLAFQRTHEHLALKLLTTLDYETVRQITKVRSWFTGTAGATRQSAAPVLHPPTRWSDQLD